MGCCPPTLGRAIYFTKPTDSNAHLIQKHFRNTSGIMFMKLSGLPMVLAGRHTQFTISGGKRIFQEFREKKMLQCGTPGWEVIMVRQGVPLSGPMPPFPRCWQSALLMSQTGLGSGRSAHPYPAWGSELAMTHCAQSRLSGAICAPSLPWGSDCLQLLRRPAPCWGAHPLIFLLKALPGFPTIPRTSEP